MDAGEGASEDFFGFEKVVEVAFGEVLTGVAGAVGVDRGEVVAEFCVTDVDAAVEGVECAVSGLAGGGDTIEGVDAVFNAEEEVDGFGAHAEPVAGFGFGEGFIDEIEKIFAFFRLIHATDCVAVEVEVCEEFGGFFAEVGELATLDDTVEGLEVFGFFEMDLVELLVVFEALECPVVGDGEGFFSVGASGVGDAVADWAVECHVDTCSDLVLGDHGRLGGHCEF